MDSEVYTEIDKAVGLALRSVSLVEVAAKKGTLRSGAGSQFNCPALYKSLSRWCLQ